MELGQGKGAILFEVNKSMIGEHDTYCEYRTSRSLIKVEE
jgi:hypothetical protein